MRCIIQRIHRASLTVDDKLISSCQKGLLVYVGFTHTDTVKNADYAINRILNMRIFRESDESKLDLSLLDIKGDIMVVPNFTLYGDPTTNRRPDFSKAMKFDQANELYNYVLKGFESKLGKVAQGVFGGHMHIDVLNDGPLNIILEK